MPLIYLSCVWVAGIWLRSSFSLPFSLAAALVVALPPLRLARRWRERSILAALGLVTVLAAIAYSDASLNKVAEDSLRLYNGPATLEIRGMVTGDPEVGDTGTRLRLSATQVSAGSNWRPVSGTALLFLPRYPAYRYGDVLLVTGKLETPSQLNDFDYRGYLAHQGIYTVVYYPKIEILGRGMGFKPLEWVYSLRGHLAESLASALPEPQAALAQGIVLGNRSNLPAALKDAFYRSGTTHILAISGMNLSIVVGMLLGLGIWLFGRRYFIYVWLALATIWGYSLLTGIQPPVVRSAVMASLFLAAELLGRQRSAITALAFGAAIMVGLSPSVLWDVSFQLSFLAMVGLVFILPRLSNLGRKGIKAWLGEDGALPSFASVVSDGFAVSLAATIAVWPLIAYYFWDYSFYRPDSHGATHASTTRHYRHRGPDRDRGAYRSSGGHAGWMVGLAIPCLHGRCSQQSGQGTLHLPPGGRFESRLGLGLLPHPGWRDMVGEPAGEAGRSGVRSRPPPQVSRQPVPRTCRQGAGKVGHPTPPGGRSGRLVGGVYHAR